MTSTPLKSTAAAAAAASTAPAAAASTPASIETPVVLNNTRLTPALTFNDGSEEGEVDFEPRSQDVIMWSLVHAQHPGNKYYTELLSEVNDLPESPTPTFAAAAAAAAAAADTETSAKTDKSTDKNTGKITTSDTATAATTTSPDIVTEVGNAQNPRAKATTVVDHIMKEKDGRFLQLVMGTVADGNLHEPSRRCKIMARNDAIQKVSQELMWLKYKKQTTAKQLLAREQQLKEQMELQEELKKKQTRKAKAAAATAGMGAAEKSAARMVARIITAEKAQEVKAQEAAAAAATMEAATAEAPLSLDGPLKLPARRPPSYTWLIAGVPTEQSSQQRPAKTKTRIKTASELSMKPGQYARDAYDAATNPKDFRYRQLMGPPAIVHKQIPQYNKNIGIAISQHQHHQQRRHGHGDRHHQNQSQRYREPAQQQQQQQQPWLRVHQEQIEENIPKDASCVVHIFDRRVNLDSHPADASMYSLLRSWAQDDPYRKIQVTFMSSITASKTTATVTTDDNGENGSSSTSGATGKKRPADAMLMTLATTAAMDKNTRPPKTRNVMQDIGTLDAGVIDTHKTKDKSANTASPPNLLQQLVGKAKLVKRRKMDVHKARMATALVSLERRGIHLTGATKTNSK